MNKSTDLRYTIFAEIPRKSDKSSSIPDSERSFNMSLIHVTKENFDEVKASDKPVLLDFFATWCGPCRMIAPFIEQIADEHPEYVVAKIDVDEEPELAQQFGVQSIPTLVVIKNGEVVNTAVGGRPKAGILELLK